MLEHINKLFTAAIILSLFTFLQRSDYNLPLFVFVGLLWNHQHPPQKVRVWYLLLFSIIVDFIWIVYWSVIWNSFFNLEQDLFNFTLIISSAAFLLKVITCIILFVREEECHQAIMELPYNFKYIFSPPSSMEYYQLSI